MSRVRPKLVAKVNGQVVLAGEVSPPTVAEPIVPGEVKTPSYRANVWKIWHVKLSSKAAVVLKGNPRRIRFEIYNNGTTNVVLLQDGAQRSSDGRTLVSGDEYDNTTYNGDVWVVADGPTGEITVTEEEYNPAVKL